MPPKDSDNKLEVVDPNKLKDFSRKTVEEQLKSCDLQIENHNRAINQLYGMKLYCETLLMSFNLPNEEKKENV